MQNKIETLRDWIDQSSRIVFFGGAGVSTESGIRDFRSVDGLYNDKYDFPPEEIISRSFFEANPAVFYRFYRDKLVVENAEPNPAHLALAELERQGKLLAVITQNIDGLHQKAGSRNVLELHGTLLRNYCARCRRPYPADAIAGSTGIPRCSCGGMIRPDIVLYEEALNEDVIASAVNCLRKADLLIVGGTSLAVYPAAGLLSYFRGDRVVLINKTATPYDRRADLVINEKIGEVFAQAVPECK